MVKLFRSMKFLDRHREEYKNKKAVNVTECGANALEVIFDYADKYNMNLSFILEHCDDLFECKERNYLIDNIIEVKSLVFIGQTWRFNYEML